MMTTQTLEEKQGKSQCDSGSSLRSPQVTSRCALCRHYQLARGGGGHCQQLNVPVLGRWKACPLAIAPFAPSWEHLEWVSSGPLATLNLTEGAPKQYC